MAFQNELDPAKIWIDLLNEVFPKGILIFAAADEFLDIISGWQTVMPVVKNEAHQEMFQESILISPKHRHEVLDHIKEMCRYVLDQKVSLEVRKNEILNKMTVRETSTFQTEELLQCIEQAPDNSAIGILDAPVYRFPNIDQPETRRIQTWMGINYRVGTAEDFAAPHLVELVRRLLPISESKKLFVTLFCQSTSHFSQSLVDEFETNDNVIFVQGNLPLGSPGELLKIQELISKTENTDITNAISQIETILSSPVNQALASSFLYFKRSQFISAWQAVEPVIDLILKSDNSTLVLNVGNTAFAAGQIAAGKKLLLHAIQLGLDSLEDLQHAYLLAREAQQSDLAEDLLSRMFLLYPSSHPTLSIYYNKLIDESKYEEALDIARQLGDEAGVKLCEAFKSVDFEIENFIEYARASDKLEWALLASSIEAIKRNRLEVSESLVDKITSEIGFSDEAVKIKAYLWGKKYISGRDLNDDLAIELEPVLSFVAKNPSRISSRSYLERLFEDDIDETTAVVVLSFLLGRSIRFSFNRLDFNELREQWKQHQLSVPSLDELENQYVLLFGSILEALPKQSAVVIGKGEIPTQFSGKIDKEFIGGLAHLIQFNAMNANPDQETLFAMLHVLALACKHLNDPSTDFLAVRLIISGFAQSGSGQLARDLAETSLQLASNQPNFLLWRYGQAWACYADAHARTGNPLSALIMLTLGFYAWSGEIHNYDQLARSYRLAIRILRDLGLTSLTLEILKLEKKLISFKDDNEGEILELEQVKLSIEVSALSRHASAEQLFALLNRSADLLEESLRLDHEFTAVLSVQATLFRSIYTSGGSVPPNIREKFDSLLPKQDTAISQLLRNLSNPFPEKNDLLNAIQRASQANHLDDLVHQLHPVVLVAENAIQAACRSGDADFFLMACAILSQPGLSIGRALLNQREFDNIRDFSQQAKSWLLSYVSNSDNQFQDPQLMEARSLVNLLIPERDTFFKQITSLSISKLSEVLSNHEVIVMLAEDATGNLCRLLVSKDSVIGPEIVSSEIWSKKSLSDWENNFFAELSRWYPKANALEEYPSSADISASVGQLSIGNIPNDYSLLLAPSSDLSTFPFVLSKHDGRHLSDVVQVSTIPSVLSLFSSRNQNLSDTRRMKAWLGDPDTLDATILYVRDRLIPIFDAFDVEIVRSPEPDKLSEASVAFVISHGNTGLSDSFVGITDTKQFFSPKDLARRMSGCGSAVLFVCSGAIGDLERSSPEIRGLTRELLNVNAKAVISSPWSLSASIPEVWLPAFLKSIASKHSFGEANFIASKYVRRTFDNPCAWASLQLYGDPAFTVLR